MASEGAFIQVSHDRADDVSYWLEVRGVSHTMRWTRTGVEFDLGRHGVAQPGDWIRVANGRVKINP